MSVTNEQLQQRLTDLDAKFKDRSFWRTALFAAAGIYLVFFFTDLIWDNDPEWVDLARSISSILLFGAVWCWIDSRITAAEHAVAALATGVGYLHQRIKGDPT